MWIKGFIHEMDYDEGTFANVHIVDDLGRRGGERVGWMELSDSTDEVVIVKRHASGNYHGQIMTEREAFGE